MQLKDYQIECVDFIKEKKSCALFLEMGLGKTVITLQAIKDLLTAKKINKVLIITNLKIANNVWQQEAKKFSNTRDLKISIATGLKNKKLEAFKEEHDIIVTNKEFTKSIAYLGLYKNYDFLVIDESTSFKSSKTIRFSNLKTIVKHFNYRLLLSGTPRPERLSDIWAQIYLLDNGKRLGKFKGSFERRYFTITRKTIWVAGQPRLIPDTMSLNENSEREVMSKIQDIVIVKKAADYVNLENPIEKKYYFKLNNPMQKKYDTLLNNFVIEVDRNNSIVDRTNNFNKIMQFINGGVYGDLTMNRKFFHVHDLKLKLLKEVIEGLGDENVLIAYNYKFDIDEIKKHIPYAVEFKDDLVKPWNEGKVKVMLIHPASAGHGLNLQYGGSTIIWYGLTYSLEKYLQTNARIVRRGQTKPPKIIYLLGLTKDSDTLADSVVLNKLKNKTSNQEMFLNIYNEFKDARKLHREKMHSI